MRSCTVYESRPTRLALSASEASLLRSLGRRLSVRPAAADLEDVDVEGPDGRSVIRCIAVPGADGTYEVTVAQAVGLVALPELELVVAPKIPLSHFWFLMGRSRTLPRIDDRWAAAEPAAPLWDLVASWFVTALEDVLRKGLLSDYEEHVDLLRVPRGRIRMLDSTFAFYQGQVGLVCEFEEFDTDSPLNRVLRAAAAAVAAAPMLHADVRMRARRSLARFDHVGPLRPSDLRVGTDRRSHHYRDALVLARHVLSATGRTIATGPYRAWTFLLRTPQAIEEGVRSVLAERLAGVGVPVVKGSLGLQGSSHRLLPDLVFGTQAIGDVKYKLAAPDWSRNDLYQITAFATGYRVERAALVAFAGAGGGALPDLQMGSVRLRAFLWDASPGVPPEDAADRLGAAVEGWLLSGKGF